MKQLADLILAGSMMALISLSVFVYLVWKIVSSHEGREFLVAVLTRRLPEESENNPPGEIRASTKRRSE